MDILARDSWPELPPGLSEATPVGELTVAPDVSGEKLLPLEDANPPPPPPLPPPAVAPTVEARGGAEATGPDFGDDTDCPDCS